MMELGSENFLAASCRPAFADDPDNELSGAPEGRRTEWGIKVFLLVEGVRYRLWRTHLNQIAMPTSYEFCCYSLVVALLIPWLGTRLMRRHSGSILLEKHKEVFGFVYAVVGVLYSIVLGYSVVGISEKFNQSEDNTHREATALVAIQTLSYGLPAENRPALKQALLNYCNDVIENEWPSMINAHMPPVTTPALIEIQHEILSMKVTTPGESAIYSEILGNMEDIAKYRSERLSHSDSLPLIAWIALTLGGVITVGFSFLFVAEHATLQMLMIGALTLSILINIDVIYALQYPFEGSVHINDEAFRMAREAITPA